MKLFKYLCAGALLLAMVACSDEPGISTKKPVTPGTNPGAGTTDPVVDDDDVVSPTPTFALVDENVSIDPTVEYQEMEGIGASDCWLPNQIGQYWGICRSDIARLLFSQDIVNGVPQGIGLSMWRVNLGGGTAEQGDAGQIAKNNRAEAYLTGNVYDWNKCAGQRYFMEKAKNYGIESIVFFSNTPLVQWTKNGFGYSNQGGKANLKDEHYADFANYMVEVAKHFKAQGYPITHISPVNEPQNNWGGKDQEGSGWRNDEIAKLAREIDRALGVADLNVKILIPEAGSYDHLYQGDSNNRSGQIDAFFNSTSANYVGNLDHIEKAVAGHSYWTHFNWDNMRSVRKDLKNKADQRGVKVWQTEWCLLDRAPDLIKNYDTATEFDLAMYMSNVMHNDFTIANASSWSFWTAMSVERYDQKNRFMLIKTTPVDGQYSDNFATEGTMIDTYNLWVLGNYSLFIRPGYKRIKLDNKDTEQFFGTGWKSPDGNTLVCVYTNYDKDKGVSLKANLSDERKPKAVYTYTTSLSKKLEQRRFKVGDDVFVEPYSVTTVVYKY